jgi:plasmid maintenance system killer protein
MQYAVKANAINSVLVPIIGVSREIGVCGMIPREVWRGVQRKLRLIDAASRLDDLAVPAGNRLEVLKGGQAGRHSIRVNDQYRATFR